MIKEAIEKVLELARPETVTAGNGLEYSTKGLQLIKEQPTVEPFCVRNLSGIVDYIKSEFDGKKNLVIHVVSATEVKVFDSLDKTNDRRIYLYGEAKLPDIVFNRFQDRESFNIMLQSCFVSENTDLAEVLELISNVVEDQGVKTTDDGLSQKVVVKQGITSVVSATLKSQYALKPFRTFVDVPQPASGFVLRLREGGQAALFEADGGVWELEAIQTIRDYFKKELENQIEEGTIKVIA